jgi:hypothetical protein
MPRQPESTTDRPSASTFGKLQMPTGDTAEQSRFSSRLHRQEHGEVLAIPKEFFDWCPYATFDAKNFPWDALTNERELSALVAFGASCYSKRAFHLISIVAEDIKAVVKQVTGMTGTGHARCAGMPSAARTDKTVLVFAFHLISVPEEIIIGASIISQCFAQYQCLP